MQDSQECSEQETRYDFPCAQAVRRRQENGASRLKSAQGISLHIREECFHHILIETGAGTVYSVWGAVRRVLNMVTRWASTWRVAGRAAFVSPCPDRSPSRHLTGPLTPQCASLDLWFVVEAIARGLSRRQFDRFSCLLIRKAAFRTSSRQRPHTDSLPGWSRPFAVSRSWSRCATWPHIPQADSGFWPVLIDNKPRTLRWWFLGCSTATRNLKWRFRQEMFVDKKRGQAIFHHQLCSPLRVRRTGGYSLGRPSRIT